jgi:hypothetical protein
MVTPHVPVPPDVRQKKEMFEMIFQKKRQELTTDIPKEPQPLVKARHEWIEEEVDKRKRKVFRSPMLNISRKDDRRKGYYAMDSRYDDSAEQTSRPSDEGRANSFTSETTLEFLSDKDTGLQAVMSPVITNNVSDKPVSCQGTIVRPPVPEISFSKSEDEDDCAALNVSDLITDGSGEDVNMVAYYRMQQARFQAQRLAEMRALSTEKSDKQQQPTALAPSSSRPVDSGKSASEPDVALKPSQSSDKQDWNLVSTSQACEARCLDSCTIL